MSPVGRWVPGIELARSYRREWLRADLFAGMALTALLVPQGMAYAQLAGLPPVTGLYASVVALVAYAVFGPSPNLIVGPDSALSPMVAAAVLPLVAAGGDPEKAMQLAGALAVLMGGLCVVAGVARLGFVTELLSKPVRVGYLNGLVVVIVAGQLPKLLGFTSTGQTVFADLRSFVDGVTTGRVVPEAAAIGIGSLLTIAALRRWLPSVPAMLVTVVGATVISAAFDLAGRGVAVAGAVPTGFARPVLPLPAFHEFGSLFLPAAGMALVALADTAALSKSFAARRNAASDATGESIALGLANVAAGLFRGFPVSGSAGRSAVAQSSGARTQLTSVVGATAIVVLLVAGHGLTADLPLASLAAIVNTAAFSLVDVRSLVWLFRVRPAELALSLSALAGVVLFGVLEGIGIAVVLSLGAFVRRAWRPYGAVLGRVDGQKGYHDIDRHPEAVQIPGLVMYRFDAPLFFANADHFERQVTDAVAHAAGPVRWLIIAAEPITDIDTTAAEMLGRLLDHLEAKGIEIAFAELKGPAKDCLRRYGLYPRVGDDRFFVTLGRAIDGYLAATGTNWVDWSDLQGGSAAL